MASLTGVSHILIPALWAAWIGYWIVAARGVKQTRWREPLGAQLLHGVPLILSLILLAVPRWLPGVLSGRVVPPDPILPFAGTLAVAAGLAFAVWGRVFLGRNWSGRVELKEDHSLVRAGPYRLVRHPIYTGMLLAVAGTALAIGEWRGVLAFALALFGILFRIRAEEREMHRTFPEYERYRRETAALIPFVL
jgi:protein-S-isoprenylcysteine O-methyltransferase Ste14